MLRSKTLLFVGTALSTLFWVACSSDNSTNPDREAEKSAAKLADVEAEETFMPGTDGLVSSMSTGIDGREHSWTSEDIEDIRVAVRAPIPVAEGCVVEASVNGMPREVRVEFDTEAESFSITSRDLMGVVVWSESYQILGADGQGFRATEVGPAGYGLSWTRERLDANRWRESVSAIGLSTAGFVVEVDYDAPESVAQSTAQFGEWLPTEVHADVFNAFEGFAIRSILQEATKSTSPKGAGLTQLITDLPTARSAVETLCILGGLCTAIKCTFGGGIANPICVGCSGITIACSICALIGLC